MAGTLAPPRQGDSIQKRDGVRGDRPHVVIVGGGFGGLFAALALRDVPVRITLVDRRNHHVFQPLLYQVATATLNPSDIAQPIRAVLRSQSNTEVVLAEVTGFDLGRRRVLLADGELDPYDHLLVATGATHSYFGHPEWARDAPGLKSIEDALDIRRRVLIAYEEAEREPDPLLQKEWLTFVVVGGGPTGVELAGALAEISRRTLLRDFRRIDPAAAQVLLLEGTGRVLPPYPADLSASAERQLLRLGVDVRTNSKVTHIDGHGVYLGEERIPARTVLWAAGVQASPLGRALGVPIDRVGRVLVEPDLSIPGHPEVYVIGDLAALSDGGKPVPGVAPAAIQEGRHTAANIERRIEGRASVAFRYVDKGSLATIGRNAGVAEFGRLHLRGFIAWLAWLLIHIVLLIGFRNRMVVLIEWAWAYVLHQRGARLITGGPPPALTDGKPKQPTLAAAPPAAPALAAPDELRPSPKGRTS